ncbi:MAG: HD domain-containing protein [Methanomicrobiaceae archaeon]|nr:HD domain-containing protein [Methanomicrobiaceae archaeon]
MTRGVDTEHPLHVTKNAVILFDCLRDIHGLGEEEERYLIAGSLLHDVGWCISEEKHHKHSMNIILEDRSLGFNDEERLIIANIARYHRKALPSDEHDNFTRLTGEEKNIVLVNSSILRVADALDRMHLSRAVITECTVNVDSVLLKCKTGGISKYEIAAVEKKSDLFEMVFKRKVKPVCIIDPLKE